MRAKNNSSDSVYRQWAILKHIPQYPRKITTSELLAKLKDEGFELTQRTVNRNLISLSNIFPLYEDDRSKPFGWSWGKDAESYIFPSLSPVQALTLVLAKDHLSNLLPANLMKMIEPYFECAENVLLGGLNIKNMSEWRGKITISPINQAMLPPSYADGVVEAIHEALFNENQIEIVYTSRAKGRKDQAYTAHPLGLIQRGPSMYLAARLFTYEDVRLLPIHRIRSVKMLKDKIRKPVGFSINKFIETAQVGNRFLSGENIKLSVRFFDKDICEHLNETPLSKDQKIIEEKNGAARVEATVQNTDQLIYWLMGFGGQIEVIKPKSVRERIKEAAKAMYDVYKD